MRGRSNGKTTVGAFGVAIALHVGLLSIAIQPSGRDEPDPSTESASNAPTNAEPVTAGTMAAVALIDEAQLGELLTSRPASFDSAALGDSHPLARADADRAGLEAAHAGGELAGGAFRETQRRDHEDQRAEIWNGNARAQVAIQSNRERRAPSASPEAVTRQRETGFDSTTDHGARTRVPDPAPRPGREDAVGERDSQGTKLPDRQWRDSDPVLDNMVAQARDAGRSGRIGDKPRTTISDRGSAQADVPRRGRLVGALDAAAASDETNPAPFELAQPGTGGSQRGVQGESGPGQARRGSGEGTASSTSKKSGRGGEAVHARRSDPYFRALYRRLDQHVKFPRDLARALEQGTVVARFRLNPDGAVSGIKVSKTSGFSGFDKALVAALRTAGPFGKVPARILGSGRSVLIIAPYRFSNPLIR